MKIEHYSFGRITIDGKTYTSDVIIYPDRVNPSWWRKQGHLLQIEDLEDIVSTGLQVLIVGTGYYGAMLVPEKTIEYFRSRKIEVYSDNTQKAVKLYNEVSDKKPAVAALHLTC
ncbi:MAG TPA: hypothetical protein ENG95_07040 [Nitrospirae bacterium]|nr:hypothetical protein [Nitrospirota bacterium]HDK16859.1 hypothetical protein [Nitrospirota bacterium]HDK81449.1 hypothetical protein [Nitrospirota bacterium]HDO26380.1 hypothetical protein [Nitrospirota bacterium]